MILLCIYCILLCGTTCLFILDICNGYFKNVNFSLIILLYIVCCLLWPIGFIVGLYDYYKMKNQSPIKRDEKENRRKLICELLDEIKLK